MTAPHLCPLPDRLEAFALGVMPEEEAHEIVEHLEHCPACELTVDSLELAGDTVVSALRTSPASDPNADDPDCQRVEARVRELVEEFAGGVGNGKANHLVAEHLGPYQLLEKIGAGGMGVVYKAVHRKLEKIVALKTLPLERTRDRTAVARFEREIRAVGKLDHPHLVRATDAGEADGTHYLVMELLDGLDLATLVRHHRRLPVAEACEVVRQAALGLQEAHRHGLVHRDVKPSNLMLARSPRAGEPPLVKILDLGLARLTGETTTPFGDLTSEQHVLGTLNYLAPEQVANTHGVDIRADIYSLGATLYKLLTGELPLPASRYPTPLARLAALAHDDIEPVENYRSDLPDGLPDIVHRMLARDPAERYGSPQEVADLLQVYGIGHDLNRLWPDGDSPPPESDPDRTPAWPLPHRPRTTDHEQPRRRLIFWTIGALGLLSLGGMTTFQFLRSDGRESRWEASSTVPLPITAPTPVPAAPDSAAAPSSSRKLTLAERNRRAVDWALGLGGKVTVTSNGQARVLRLGEELPFNDYELEIDLNLNSNVDDAGLENLRGATAIRRLILNGTRISTLEPVLTLTNLNWINCSIDILDAADVGSLAALPSLRRLSLGIFASTPPPQEKAGEVFAAACQLTQLGKLEFGSFYYSLGDASLAELRHMQQLKALHLGSKTLTDEGIQNLPVLPEMTWLFLSCEQVTAVGLVCLDRHPKLDSLWLDRLVLNGDDLQELPDLPHLNSLILDECRGMTGTGLSRWKVWPRLKVFRMVEMAVTDADLDALASVDTQIERLVVVDSPVLTDAAVESFAKLKRLTTLELTGCLRITDDSIPALCKLQGLTRLDVARTSLTSDGIDRLQKGLPRTIITFALPAASTVASQPIRSQASATRREVAAPQATGSSPPISAEPTVVERNRRAVDWALAVGAKVTVTTDGQSRLLRAGEELPFNDCSLKIDLNLNSTVDNAGLENLRDATAIRELSLIGTQVSSLESVLTLKNLETLFCSVNVLDADEVRSLANLSSLRHVQFGMFSSPVPPDERADQLFAAACRLSQVEQLGFGSFFYVLDDAALPELRHMSQLKILHLGSRTATDEGLRNLPPLEELNRLSLGCPQVTARGLIHLDRHPKLEELALRHMALAEGDLREVPDLPNLNFLEFVRCSKLTGAGLSQWPVCSRLKTLRLIEMPVTDADLAALAAVGNRIEWLVVVDSPRLTDAAVESFSKMQRLAILELTGCTRFTDDSVPALSRLQGLTRFDVSRTGLSPDGIAKLRQALPQTIVTAD